MEGITIKSEVEIEDTKPEISSTCSIIDNNSVLLEKMSGLEFFGMASLSVNHNNENWNDPKSWKLLTKVKSVLLLSGKHDLIFTSSVGKTIKQFGFSKFNTTNLAYKLSSSTEIFYDPQHFYLTDPQWANGVYSIGLEGINHNKFFVTLSNNGFHCLYNGHGQPPYNAAPLPLVDGIVQDLQ